MASNVGPTGRILAFEPDAFSFGLLQSCTKDAGAHNIESYRLVLGDKTGRVLLYCNAYNRADNRLSPSHRTPHVQVSEVQVYALDDFIASHALRELDGLKSARRRRTGIAGSASHTKTPAPMDLDRVFS